MARKITVQNENQQKPGAARWRKIGAAGHADYMVRFDRGHMGTGHTHCDTLTEARKCARNIVKEGRAWAEVFRYWETGQAIGKAFICSYEVETESGAAVP